ncbi:putative phage tail protein [Pseudobacillus badius]|uniref:putative phage tail protein n=1 Tax=Bacillus badius TaxID=1455 RepID=UPI001CC0E973|nr:putative phage tail protein [Bacillus badius]UAT31976.1 YmfQ family protein [Bacillus badius]GLY12205.1 hypothetical protein Bbad01_34210 [Bacillus badius]
MSSQEEMLTDLPAILRESPEYQEMARVQGKIFDRLEGHIDEVLDNTFIDDATWGLTIMEKEFKIPTEINKPLDQRRSALKAKKRGIGRVSASLIKSVAESFQNGSAEVKAIKGKSRILVKFNDAQGFPPNLTDVQRSIREILPAHLAYVLGLLIHLPMGPVMTTGQKLKLGDSVTYDQEQTNSIRMKVRASYLVPSKYSVDPVDGLFLDGSFRLNGQNVLDGMAPGGKHYYLNQSESLTIKTYKDGNLIETVTV